MAKPRAKGPFDGETVLICGGAGFIGSNLVRTLLEYSSSVKVVCYDALTYAGHKENLEGLPRKRGFTFIKGDIVDEKSVQKVLSKFKPKYIINCAAETHVDRSIHGHAPEFARTNIIGTLTLLSAARTVGGFKKFIQVSTDEVYGALPLGSKRKFTESSPLAPNSPYAASKAAADMIALSFFATYGLPIMITRCSNNYGPYQHPEKFIPYSVSRLLAGKPVALYGDGNHVRDWIHVSDHSAALIRVLEKGTPGEVYNVGASEEVSNRILAGMLLDIMGKDRSMTVFVADRPGHDRRYAIDASKIRKNIGWKPVHSLKRSLRDTIHWYADNQAWTRAILAQSGHPNPHIAQ